jgi:hypothetical protein
MYRVVHVLIATTHDTRNSLFDIITTRGEKGGRGTLTPVPSPALRKRGDLGYKCGIVERYRIAPAPLIPPFRSRSVGEEGGLGGKVRGPTPDVIRNTMQVPLSSLIKCQGFW